MKHAKVTTVAVVASAVVGLGVAATTTAHAGSNGQQISVCIGEGDYSHIQVNGTNPDGQPQEATNAGPKPGGCVSLAGFWWKGHVSIAATESHSGRYLPTTGDCDVPTENPTSDFFTCEIGVGALNPTGGKVCLPEAVLYRSALLVTQTLTEYSFNPAFVPNIIC